MDLCYHSAFLPESGIPRTALIRFAQSSNECRVATASVRNSTATDNRALTVSLAALLTELPARITSRITR